MSRRSLIRNERGTAVTEFGILIIPLFLVLLGMLDMGYGMYLRSVLQGAVNDVSRSAIVEDPTFSGTGTTEQRIKVAIRERLAGLASRGDWEVEIASFDSFSRVNKPEKFTTNPNGDNYANVNDCWIDRQADGIHNSDPVSGVIGGADDIALYTATMTMPRILPMAELAGLPENYVVTVKSAVRNQPYANQTLPPPECRSLGERGTDGQTRP